jgi:hypothetical protein
MHHEFNESKFIFRISDLEMSIRSSSRANKGKNPRLESPEATGLRNESCISTASPTQSQPAALIPLGATTQARWDDVPQSLKELVCMPLGRDSKTRQFQYPEERDHNAEEPEPSSEPASDDDRPASQASSDLMVPLPHPELRTPGYTVQYSLKMEGIKKDWSQMHLVRPGSTFPLVFTSKRVHQQAFIAARSLGQTSCTLKDVEAEVLYTGQAKIHALKTTFDELEVASWDAVIDSILSLDEEDKRRQIRVNLVYFYRPKALEVTDCMPDVLPAIKRGGEGVLLPGESPAKKKGKPATIHQYTSARASSSTARGLLAADTRQLQFEHEGKDHVREILKLYHCQLSKCDNPAKICIHKGGRHFMFNRELPKLWSDAIIVGDATILSIPVNLLHLLTIQEPGELRRRGREEGDLRPSTPATPMPQIIMMPPQPYQFPPLPPQQYLPPPAPAGRQSSPPGPEDPADLYSYIAWFKLREPLLVDTIEECLVVLSQEKDTLSTLERISEARIARHGLPAGLMTRLKDSVKTWRRTAS